MIDFDPSVKDVLMPQDLAMKFMIWAGYYNGLDLVKGQSFARFGKFSGSDVERLDRLQTVLFKCFQQESVSAAMRSIRQARINGEPCPFPEESLNELFGNTVTI